MGDVVEPKVGGWEAIWEVKMEVAAAEVVTDREEAATAVHTVAHLVTVALRAARVEGLGEQAAKEAE